MAISIFNNAVIEQLSKILADTQNGFTSSEIGTLLHDSNIPDIEPTITKWRRLNVALTHKQTTDKCANNILSFLQNALNPARHINRPQWFNDTRYEINRILSFEGYEIGDNGKVVQSKKATTINEATARAQQLRTDLIARKVHHDVLLFCKEELLVDNYFHTVFEATKSIAEKIRNKTDLNSDGSELVDEAFAFKNQIPHLALNSLVSESEQSEQKGFMNLLKGVFGTFRNTTAHAPKITWKIAEEDALDILSMISLIHRRLDKAIEAKKMYQMQ